MPLDEFWRTMSVDLFGTFLGCRFAIPHMATGGGGSIINTTSIRALLGTAGADAYSAAHGGVMALTRAPAIQQHTARTRVHATGPSVVATPPVRALLPPDDPLVGPHLPGVPEPAPHTK